MARSDPNEEVIRTTIPERIWWKRTTAGDAEARRRQSALPEDAVAIIEVPPKSVTQGRKARSQSWLLRFPPRRPMFHDPLTGWAGGDDPLAHLSIRFPSREAAVRYAERQGLAYEVREPNPVRTAGAKLAVDQAPRLCCWPTGPHPLCCGDYPALTGNDAEQAR